MTRIAASNPDMWRDICIDNSEAILGVLDEFSRNLAGYRKNIVEGNKDGLWTKFKQAQSVRTDLPKILHKDLSDLWELSVLVTDKPGIISQISVTIGRLGINIEDIEITHMTEHSGVIRLVINGEEESQSAAKVLRESGYQVEIRTPFDREVP